MSSSSSSSGDEEDGHSQKTETKGKMVQRHKRELKELKTKIAAMLHAVSKNDKKKKKEVQDQTQKLEDELKARHEAEVAALEKAMADVSVSGAKSAPALVAAVSAAHSDAKSAAAAAATEQREAAEEEEEEEEEEEPAGAQSCRKPSRQQRRKAKKAEEEQKLREKIEREKKNVKSARAEEIISIKKKLRPLSLTLKEISADGNCLYNAIGDQLANLQNKKLSAQELRTLAADYMKSNPNEFIPFIPLSDEADSGKAFEKFCDQIKNTTAWGGQLELQALVHCLRTSIIIHSATSPDVNMGEQFSDHQPLHLAYHKFYYALGEHYNSVVPEPRDEQ